MMDTFAVDLLRRTQPTDIIACSLHPLKVGLIIQRAYIIVMICTMPVISIFLNAELFLLSLGQDPEVRSSRYSINSDHVQGWLFTRASFHPPRPCRILPN